MGFVRLPVRLGRRSRLACALLVLCAPANQLVAQHPDQGGQDSPAAPSQDAAGLPSALVAIASASVAGVVTDTDQAGIASARVTLEDVESKATRNTDSDSHGAFLFPGVSPGRYIVTVHAAGFAPWKINGIIVVHEGEDFVVPKVELGVESITTTVSAISMEDLAEQQITAEVHQRILGVLPNFYVSYVPDAAPLTRKQKFKLALHVSVDPVTYFTTGVNAGIEQWQGDYAGYGQGFSGYAQRYAATYGDRLSSTFLGAAALPSLLHQDPRYFYRGHGNVAVRALYAISTVAVCKGDNGHWQPNYSNILGNLGAAGISTLYYPQSDQHDIQVTVTNTLLGVAEGAFGTLFQEFLLRHLTHGAPPKAPLQP
jgi:hypothetical protein